MNVFDMPQRWLAAGQIPSVHMVHEYLFDAPTVGGLDNVGGKARTSEAMPKVFVFDLLSMVKVQTQGDQLVHGLTRGRGWE